VAKLAQASSWHYRRSREDLPLCQRFLGLLDLWRVEAVRLKVAARQVEARVGFADTLWGSPECRVHARPRLIGTAVAPVGRLPDRDADCGVRAGGAQPCAWGANGDGDVEGALRAVHANLRAAGQCVVRVCSIPGAFGIQGFSWGHADGIKQPAGRRVWPVAAGGESAAVPGRKGHGASSI